MDRFYQNSGVGSPPPTSPSSGDYPTAGNPVTATPATRPGAYWFYMITESLRNVVVGAGKTPDKDNLNLLKEAIQQIVGDETASKLTPTATVSHFARTTAPAGGFACAAARLAAPRQEPVSELMPIRMIYLCCFGTSLITRLRRSLVGVVQVRRRIGQPINASHCLMIVVCSTARLMTRLRLIRRALLLVASRLMRCRGLRCKCLLQHRQLIAEAV